MKKFISVLLSLSIIVLLVSVYSQAASPAMTGLKIISLPEKRVFYKNTDWINGIWESDEAHPGECILIDSPKISFTHNPCGGIFGERGMIDMTGLVIEVTYSDGTSKKIEYKETKLKSGFYTANILVAPAGGKDYFIGTNKLEVYLAENYKFYDTYEIEITDKEKEESYFRTGEKSTAIISGKNYISGLKLNMNASELKGYFEYSGVEVTTSKAEKSFKYYGTGSKLTVKYPDGKTEEYTVLIYGDIDGNGVVDTEDIALTCEAVYDSSVLNPLQQKAANVDGMRLITADDLAIIKECAMGEPIPQF